MLNANHIFFRRIETMAFFTDIDEGNYKVIGFSDAAIINTSREQYDDYLKDLDETKLTIEDGGIPTRFVMRKVIPYKLSLRLKNSQVMMKDGEMQPQLSFMNEEVRLRLVDIENPPVPKEYEQHLLVHKKDGDGGTSPFIMEKLETFKVITDLYSASQNAAPKSSLSERDKKK